jgi:hypothetical protein
MIQTQEATKRWLLIELHIADFKIVVTSVGDVGMFVLLSRCAISFLRSSSPLRPSRQGIVHTYLNLTIFVLLNSVHMGCL